MNTCLICLDKDQSILNDLGKVVINQKSIIEILDDFFGLKVKFWILKK